MIFTLKCSNCGAPLDVGPDLEFFACGYCDAAQMVERKGGIVELKLVVDAIARVQSVTDQLAAKMALKRLRTELPLLARKYDEINKAGLNAIEERTTTMEESLSVHRVFMFCFFAILFGCITYLLSHVLSSLLAFVVATVVAFLATYVVFWKTYRALRRVGQAKVRLLERDLQAALAETYCAIQETEEKLAHNRVIEEDGQTGDYSDPSSSQQNMPLRNVG